MNLAQLQGRSIASVADADNELCFAFHIISWESRLAAAAGAATFATAIATAVSGHDCTAEAATGGVSHIDHVG